jgi:hypothetical protein
MEAFYYGEIVRRYRVHCTKRAFWSAAFISFLLFFLALGINSYAENYTTRVASSSVTDIVLSNTPAVDVDGLFVYGITIFIIFVILVLLANPQDIPFTLCSLAVFYLTRAVFVSLTHVAPFPIETPVNFTSNIGIFLSHIFFGGDSLFFSAHTGAPFLLALIFWHQRVLRYIFLASSVFFAGVVLLGHIHYSIDVASAFYISFGIYHMSMWLFKKDYIQFFARP